MKAERKRLENEIGRGPKAVSVVSGHSTCYTTGHLVV